ncbi:hypothetical protein DQ04_00161060 [Trypanosoma grayi]|uniref:hypothetical protein n=1 Tax=Trypanosoma grayi TaxID=71804 RepID=UPI0004F40B7D|nr:hypothetical protein DQ04_00161060 [Trypanosoma grayi]KEG15166.1 hypothetical protein DQ04_00161060 [Trypanosoma grayi]
MNTRSLAKITAAVAMGYVAYRGMRSFLRNEITVSITEVVHLPPSDKMLEVDEQATLVGEIQCEAYLMHSYRFQMKLAANIKGGSLQPSSTPRLRHRVMHMAENGKYRNVVPYSGSKKREGFPSILVDDVNCMVDYWELAMNGGIFFTPACIGDELLLRYEGPVKEGCTLNTAVRNCYIQTDGTPGLKRLSFDLVVYDVVHAVKVHIELPNRYCEVVAIHTGGVGRIHQPNPHKPHHFDWEVNTVDETTWKGVKELGPDVLPEARLARRGFTDEDLTAAMERGGRKGNDPGSMANNYPLRDVAELRLEEKGEDFEEDDCSDAAGGMLYHRERSGLPDGKRLLDAHFILIFEEPDGVEYDYASSDSDLPDDEDEGDNSNNNNNGRTTRKKSGRSASHADGKSSKKSLKREERARRKQLQRRSVDSILTAGLGVSTRVPSVELSYSVVGLASGVTVRKLQTVSDRPNWAPRSLLDTCLLRWLVPGILQRRLGKYAHYTTWFVQPVPVALL